MVESTIDKTNNKPLQIQTEAICVMIKQKQNKTKKNLKLISVYREQGMISNSKFEASLNIFLNEA